MNELERWLAPLGLGHLAPVLLANDVDLEILSELNEADLEKLGLSLGQRKKLLKAAACLPQASSAPIVAPAANLSATSTAERRQLTVVFCDLIGSTALAARLDLEDLREVIGAYHRCVAETVARFDGFVAKYMGDGVLIYFGYPQAHENDAERAVRAALDLVDAVGKLQASERLRVRVGIATGLAVVGDLIGTGAAQEQAVVGETPNLAARLQTLADPDAVVIAQSTRRLMHGLFDLTDLGRHDLKGFAEPVQAWRVLGQSSSENRFEAWHARDVTPLVGREHELGFLLDRWEQAKEGDGQVVLLSGEAGIGKSRLVRALRERLTNEPYTHLSHFCSPFHQTSALYPIIDLFERAARLSRDEPPERSLGKLEALIAQATTDVAAAVPLIAVLLSIPLGERYPAPNLTPQRQKEDTFGVLLAQLAGLAADQPVLALYEDVHWSDPTTLELLERVIERVQRLPILVLVTFRPEFIPPWRAQAHVTSFTLNRLSRNRGAAMVADLTNGKTLPSEVLNELLAKTDGVPLFIEELTKTVLEAGLLKDEGERFALAVPLPTLAIPTTLRDSLMARLDRLGGVKEVLQVGATIGREFGYELLAAATQLDETELQDALRRLIEAELVFARGAPPNSSYMFKHALVRDAAYESQLKSRRKQLHSRIAQHLQEMAETQPEIIAHHLTCAELYERACDYWLSAGVRNASRSAYVEATSQLRMALQTAGGIADPPLRQEKELEIRSSLASALRVTWGHVATELEDEFKSMLKLAEEMGKKAHSSHALNGLALVYLNRGDLTHARTFATGALTCANHANERSCELLSLRTIGTVLFLLGEFTNARAELQRCVDTYKPEHDHNLIQHYSFDPLVASHGFLSWTCWVIGYPDTARQHLEAAHRYASELEHGYSIIFSHLMSAVLHLMLREPDASLIHAEAVIGLSAEQRLPYFSSIAKACQGWAQAKGGSVEPGLTQLREGLEAHQAVPWEPLMHCSMAEILAAEARVDEALACLTAADLVVEQTGAYWWAAEIARVRGVALLAAPTPDLARAGSSLELALEMARAQRAMSWELRVAINLARHWAKQGRRAEAQDLLRPVYGWFTEGFDTVDLKEAEALLDELG